MKLSNCDEAPRLFTITQTSSPNFTGIDFVIWSSIALTSSAAEQICKNKLQNENNQKNQNK